MLAFNNFLPLNLVQVLNYSAGQNHIIFDNEFIFSNNLVLSPVSPNDIIHTLLSLFNSKITGSDSHLNF